MNLKIVIANRRDAEALAKILSGAVRYKMEHGDGAWGDTPYTRQEAERLIGGARVYLAYQNEELVGTFSLQDKDVRVWGATRESAIYLHRLAVSQGAHGRHIGEQLLSCAARETANMGYSLLRLDCDERNTSLRSYYEQHGFKMVGRRQPTAADHYVAALYEQRIAPNVYTPR